MIRHFALLIVLACCCARLAAQNAYTISGSISDATGPIPGAAVYLSGYQKGTVSDQAGRFVIGGLAPGRYEILVQAIGYLPQSAAAVITDRSVSLTLVLKENPTLLAEVVIRPDPNREYYMTLFRDYFIGRTPNAKDCRILNTNVLQAHDDRDARKLCFSASDFLIIENRALGYRIRYLLDAFEYDYQSKILYYAGHPTFEELPGSAAKKRRWEKNRLVAYQGSSVHFYRSLYANRLSEEGFELLKISTIKNPAKIPDSVTHAKIKKLMQANPKRTSLITHGAQNDSLSYWIQQRKVPQEVDVLSRAPVLTDTLVKPSTGVLKQMAFADGLFVIYKNEKESEAYNYSGFKVPRPADIGNFQVTVIRTMVPPIRFYPNGAVDEARSALYSGFWSYEKAADMLPLDYRPPSR